MSTNRIEVSQTEQGEWIWRCWECGWAGLNCGSQSYAEKESAAHACPVDDVTDGQIRRARAHDRDMRRAPYFRRDVAALGGDPSL